MSTIRSINPTTGETLREFQELTDGQLEEKLARSALAFQRYRRPSSADRATWLRRAADIRATEKQTFGRLLTSEMGKTLAAATAEAEKCAFGCRYFADNGERFLQSQRVNTEAVDSYITYQPIGVVL